jgi:hypothetical protein
MSIPSILIEKNHPAEKLARLFWQAHVHAREAVRAALMTAGSNEMTKVASVTAADTIYGIDTIAEAALFTYLETHQHEAPAFVLTGEFETGEAIQFGKAQPQFRVLLDPIDGTRLLMHKKASGWILTGIAPERGDATRLRDIFFSLQTELPPPKQTYADTLWASQFSAAHGICENLATREQSQIIFNVERSADLQHGFISFVNLFPRGKQVIAALEEEFLYSPAIIPPDSTPDESRQHATAPIFEDQHLSTGGQLYALMTGQMRLVADFRPLLNRQWRSRAEATVLCAHPYDLAAWLIAPKAGVSLYAADGSVFDGPTNPTAEIGWLGFANQKLADAYLSTLLKIFRQNNLIG